MRHITFAYLGSEEAAGKLAKKGTATDITLFNGKSGDAHLNLVTASRFPEKIMSLLYALDLADQVVLAPAAIDRALGETIVAAELLGKTHGFVRAQGGVDASTLAELLSKTALRGLVAAPDADGALRERLYEQTSPGRDGALVLPVDHSFPVKGVGTVLLGLVRQGTIRTHDKLRVFPTDRVLDVRSVQVHDVDVPSAGPGSRVGLAVKGVEPADAGRGRILAPDGSLRVVAPQEAVRLKVAYSKFNRWVPRPGAVLHAFHALQDVVVRVEETGPIQDGTGLVVARWESAMAWDRGSALVFVDVDNKGQRLVGSAKAEA